MARRIWWKGQGPGMKTHTLFIWEQVPEQLDTYLIPNGEMTREMSDALKVANGCYMNATKLTDEQEAALQYLNYALVSQEHKTEDNYFTDGYPMEKRCVLDQYKREIVKGEPLF